MDHLLKGDEANTQIKPHSLLFLQPSPKPIPLISHHTPRTSPLKERKYRMFRLGRRLLSTWSRWPSVHNLHLYGTPGPHPLEPPAYIGTRSRYWLAQLNLQSRHLMEFLACIALESVEMFTVDWDT